MEAAKSLGIAAAKNSPAIPAHAAFVSGWAAQHDEAAERMRAARAYARLCKE
ncbi:hypothetical protein [Streptosporangium sp. CA-115845]|uniref:hypothetical protein n=1 Tax=Streptosporangium sp. CA-115845 TaxID=3240071 RepID=UPI003D923BF4